MDGWMDGEKMDQRNLGVVNWRAKAQERDGWRKFLKQAKTPQRIEVPMMMHDDDDDDDDDDNNNNHHHGFSAGDNRKTYNKNCDNASTVLKLDRKGVQSRCTKPDQQIIHKKQCTRMI
jgi:hypothetical protein